ncbi:hypothetical protein NAC44_10525 [Allorhizobium sp. BGMRC 0089]|uniref:hypothetical protein n=1 Tax=Allorhizobium sonneratiae TaxID=2934936 RepID=UPI0020338651|nr:hypothetical protein [Allorhizobium sonneratiae]MCM2292757.1 hypothetical protein [Allorhizobium sonneratiae]
MDNPRIKTVRPQSASFLKVEWQDGTSSTINLTSWIDKGGLPLSALKLDHVWQTAKVEDFGLTVTWAGADLAIDAWHLFQHAREEQSFNAENGS